MTATTAPATRTWTKGRDDYGRTTATLRNDAFRAVAVVVTLPKRYLDEHGSRYLVTDLRMIPMAERVVTHYFVKRSDAVAWAEVTFPA